MGEAAVDLCTGRDPHADVRPALDRLQETGLALVR
jgi:hypothetical protein